MKNKLTWLFYLIFCICFTFVCINSLLRNMYFNISLLTATTLICFLIIGILCTVIWKYLKIDEKKYKIILITFSILMFFIEIIMGLQWQYDPQFDIGAVHKGAIEWVKTGTFENYYEYFSSFPNNIGSMTFLFIFAKIVSFFGVTNFHAVFIVVNSIIVTLSISLISIICKRLANIKFATLALIISFCSIQLWFLGGAVYTDSLSMLFPILIFWLYLISKEKQGKNKLLIYLLIAILATIGSFIKMTVIIMPIAIIIDLLLKKEFKEFAKLSIFVVVTFSIISLGFNAYLYSNHLDKQHKEIVERPVSHWIMMGLAGDGRYNGTDYSFTDSFNDPKEKRTAIKQEIINRIKNRGFSGMYDLILKKSILDFGDGTYGMADFLGQPSESKTKLRDLVLFDGKNYEIYATSVTGMHMVVMFLMLLGAYLRIVRKTERNDDIFPLYLSIFGVWLFLMCWETNRRYFSNFIPIIFICATLAINDLILLKNKLKEELKH